jgi:integrase
MIWSSARVSVRRLTPVTSGANSGAITAAAGLGQGWTPQEPRHTFVSLLSATGTPVEEIARLAGHSSTQTTEVIYRQELRPVLTRGAEAMDAILS